MYKGKEIKYNWVVDKFASDIKDNLLYGEADRLVSELPNGDTLEAEICHYYSGDPCLSLCYRHKGEIHTDANLLMDWFPDDDKLLEEINSIYEQERS